MRAKEMTTELDLPVFVEGQRLTPEPLMQLVACIRELRERVAVLEADLKRIQTPKQLPEPASHEVWVRHDGTVGEPE